MNCTECNCPPLSYLLATLYVNSEQSPTVALGTAGDAAHLRGRGQMCWLQNEVKMEERRGKMFDFRHLWGENITI